MKDLVDIFRDNRTPEDIWWNQDDYDEDGMENLTLFDEEDLDAEEYGI